MTPLSNFGQISSLCTAVIYFGCIFSMIICQEESAEDKSGVPIIRQINKVNDDGTYTYGYEAADGSFKIETRDVLGNVKGMFGYIDETGELKRVSYTANNSTGFKPRGTTTSRVPIRIPSISTGYTTIRPSSSSDIPARRPVLILKNTPTIHSSTKAPVIQHIPKKMSSEGDDDFTTTSTTSTTPAFGDYINGRRFNSKENETLDESTDDTAPKTTNPLRKVLVSKRPVEEKDIPKGKGGNALRRQLSKGYEVRPGDSGHVYGGADGRYSSATGLPPHLNALMSELHAFPRPNYIGHPGEHVTYGPADSEVPVSPQDVTDYPLTTTTTEIPYRTSPSRYVLQIPRYQSRPSIVDESQYPDDAGYRPPNQPISPPIPIPPGPIPGSPYPLGPPPLNNGYYEPGHYSIPHSLRDELMALIHNYLQYRLQNPYYGPPRIPYPNPYFQNNLFVPQPNYPLGNLNFLPYPNIPYGNPGPPYYTPFANPNAYYPAPNHVPYSNPNIQGSTRQPAPGSRSLPLTKSQTVRSPVDDADLLQMLLASPTRIPIQQLKYSPTTERDSVEYRSSSSSQPIRNVQIISETNSRPVTTESSDK